MPSGFQGVRVRILNVIYVETILNTLKIKTNHLFSSKLF